jgi:hypothetical protein
MPNFEVSHSGGTPTGYDVPATGIRVWVPNDLRSLVVFTNASDTPIYLALCTSPDGTTCQAVVGRGIYLAAAGGGYEMNSTNMGYCEVWAIHNAAGLTKRLYVQAC